ncbi:MAG: hypothetical protein M1820_005586 [Bogoriella megaspora]|nr:MAG: hypothetical protein M1820_005586 [Bogoriella megaspora]
MSFNPSQTPDLASVLATLREFAPPQQQQQYAQYQQDRVPEQSLQPQHNNSETVNNGVFDDPRPSTKQDLVTPSQDSRSNTPARDSPRPPRVDTTTIIDWPSGLKAVSKAAAQNAAFADSIRKMVRDQRHHEQQWYMQRQNLKQQQARRGDGAKQAQDVLKTFGSASRIEATTITPEEREAELRQFDMKIYKAQCDMANIMTTELKALGVPFFGTKSSLIYKGSENSSAVNANGKRAAEDETKLSHPGQIDEKKFTELQRKMLQYLEDMYME